MMRLERAVSFVIVSQDTTASYHEHRAASTTRAELTCRYNTVTAGRVRAGESRLPWCGDYVKADDAPLGCAGLRSHRGPGSVTAVLLQVV